MFQEMLKIKVIETARKSGAELKGTISLFLTIIKKDFIRHM